MDAAAHESGTRGHRVPGEVGRSRAVLVAAVLGLALVLGCASDEPIETAAGAPFSPGSGTTDGSTEGSDPGGADGSNGSGSGTEGGSGGEDDPGGEEPEDDSPGDGDLGSGSTDDGFAWVPFGPADPSDPPPEQLFGALERRRCAGVEFSSDPPWPALAAVCRAAVEGDESQWALAESAADDPGGDTGCFADAARALLDVPWSSGKTLCPVQGQHRSVTWRGRSTLVPPTRPWATDPVTGGTMSRINGTSLGVDGTAVPHLRGAAGQIHAAKAQHDRYTRAIRTLDRYVVPRADGTVELTVERPQDAGVDPDLFQELRLSVAGASTGEWGGAAAEAGDRSLHVHWWGVEIVLDDVTTRRLVDAARKSPAALAAILAGLGVPPPVAADIGGALFALPGLLWAVCAYGDQDGLVVHRTWAGQVWVWHR